MHTEDEKQLIARSEGLLNFMDNDDDFISPQSNNYMGEAHLLIKSYLSAPRIPYPYKEGDPKNSPLQFWKANDAKYSDLFKLAIAFLSIPGSSVPVERMFSTSGYLVTARRNRLAAHNVQLLTFLNINYDLLRC